MTTLENKMFFQKEREMKLKTLSSVKKIGLTIFTNVIVLGFMMVPSVVSITLAEEDENSIAKKLNLSLYGYVEASYTQNFNNPSTGVNNMRSFDGDSNSFRPNNAQLVLEKGASATGKLEDRAGFRLKLNFGEDAKFSGGSAADDFDFQEAYVNFIAPIGNGITIQGGRMNTLIGYEVIESPYNPNFSRSFMFGMGEPFTVTGLRASYDFNEYVSFAASVINSFTGLQVERASGNSSKSIEALLSIHPMNNVVVSLFGFWGPEGARNVQNSERLLFGGIFDAQVTDKAKVVVEAYYANHANNSTFGALNSRWNGVAGYFIYDFNDQWGARVRSEIFEDAGGTQSCAGSTALGNALVCNTLTGAVPQTLWEMTYTLQYKPVPNLITRVEFRYDKSNKNTFDDGFGRAGNNQSTLAGEAIFLF
ncbi:MAG: outer membrane beta-barrel protein [Nitrospirae bacterium]|nr:outer membrane beta-barrel protein [Nitrospirota bacterium]